MEKDLAGHRCFKIPRSKLDLFLKSLDANFSNNLIEHRMEYVFISEDVNFYDVIVGVYGFYPYISNHLEKFVNEL